MADENNPTPEANEPTAAPAEPVQGAAAGGVPVGATYVNSSLSPSIHL